MQAKKYPLVPQTWTDISEGATTAIVVIASTNGAAALVFATSMPSGVPANNAWTQGSDSLPLTVSDIPSGTRLYAYSDKGCTVQVIGNGVVTLASAASSSPGGGPNNTADHSDPNNAYLAAMAA